ncbi:molybdopterin-dependent oxidoreductase [Actinokineospora fastidiosa]|uniref:Molybdopterin-binding protein n=1 Tax=Actinokineospora fastidiosa TaxID=1816 RepID=A0A918G7A8_9PSEU|nr:molybdopterin-dependent oxidoreductase [Actinokineospora fastidiosa]GGS22148.1 molybdopterin-binding protein [Actinokineospora fastidiosa]
METRLRRPTAALIGVLSVGAALAAGHLVAAFVGINASPYLAVSNSMVDLSPPWLTEFGKQFGPEWDKKLLFAGIAVGIAGFAVAAGLLSRRSAVPGVVVAVVLGAVAVAAVLFRPDLGQLAVLAPLTTFVVGAAVFRWLHRLAMDAADGVDTTLDRRRFLITSGGVAAGFGLAAIAGQVLGTRVDIEASRRAVGPIVPDRPAPPVPATADFSSAGTPTFITPNSRFYRIDTALTVPRLRAEDWALRIHGLVDTELELDFADIAGRELVERVVTMTCVSNEVGGDLISTAAFTGVPMRELLAEAGVRPEAGQVYATSVDGWTTATPVADMMSEERGALLAIGMNGEPLPVEHGFPARVVVPGLYGYVSATKWVVDLELIRDGEKTFYWQDRGWAKEAPIKTQSRIDAPRAFQNLPAGKVTIAGVAWAQTVGVETVEVRVDGGVWRAAELAAEVNDQTWRMWRLVVDLPPGNHRAEVRATDASGHTQAEERVPPIPDGATGWHSILFTVS